MMLVKPITIRHEWSLTPYDRGYIMLTSGRIHSHDLPHVRFEIICIPTRFLNTLSILVRKTPVDPASAIIKIFRKNNESSSILKMVETNRWTDTYDLRAMKLDCSNDDKIELNCEIIWHGSEKESRPINLYDNISHFRDISKFADVIIDIDNEEIPVHKVILASQSPVFLAMLETDMTGSANDRIIVKDIQLEIMKKVIDFLYTGKISAALCVDDVFLILSVADKYQIMHLRNACIKDLLQKLTVNNVLQILEASNSYAVPELVEQIIAFITIRRQDMIRLSMNKFSGKNPVALLVKYSHHLFGHLH